MEIFRKLTSMFSGKKPVPEHQPENDYGPLPSLGEIESLLYPLARNATAIKLKDASRLHPDSAIRSQFGGNPYFEQGMTWPVSDNRLPLDFVFQVFANENTELPKDIKLIQFFYSQEELPNDTDDTGWLVKIFRELNIDKQVVLPRPEGLEDTPYCDVVLESALSLPDWEGINEYLPEITDTLERLNADEPWELYEQICEKITGSCYYQTQLGGYPRWVQGESTPVNSRGERVPLLFQVDSEDNAGLMWGDVGLVYIFYYETDDKVWFEFQCH